MASMYPQLWRSKSLPSTKVTPAMVRRLRTYGVAEAIDPGTHLFQQGERLVDLFFVLEGELELYERKGRNSCEVASTLDAFHFTGELDLLNDRPTLLNCRAIRKSRVLRIHRTSVRQLMRAELDIAELILTEWIVRRACLRQRGQRWLVGAG